MATLHYHQKVEADPYIRAIIKLLKQDKYHWRSK